MNRLVNIGATAFAIAMIAFMLLSPAYRQVFGGRSHALRAWVMFSSVGLDLCAVDFVDHRGDGGADVPLDRYEVLETSWMYGPKSVRVIRSERDARILAQKLCRRVPVGTDIRGTVDCADKREGWKRVISPDEGLCR